MRAARLALFGTVAACSLGPRPPPAPPRQTQLAVTISRFDLTNGLRVVLVADPQMAEVQVTMRYQVGSVDDPPDHPGMAHLVEHLMYQQALGAQSLFAHLETIATAFNGDTELDTTTFYARSQIDHLDELLSIEAVRIGFGCTSITDSLFMRERAVVANELRQNALGHEIRRVLHSAAYPDGHPYRRASAGTPAAVEAMTREQACAFAAAHYAPNNAVLVVSGNVTQQQVARALGKFIARIPQRQVAAPTPVPEVATSGRHLRVEVPFDGEAVLLAWSLPRDRQRRTRIRALVAAAVGVIDASVPGFVRRIELGDERAPLVGIVVAPASGESTKDVIDAAQRALAELPRFVRDELVFDEAKQSAIYELYATLEDGSDRERRLARYVLEGADPRSALADDFQALRELTRDTAVELAREELAFDRAAVVVLAGHAGASTTREAALAQPIHDLGQRRDPPDPAEAHVAAAPPAQPDVAAMRTRVLPNGLRVVLLPITSVPTIDLELVFGAGTADEPADRRGAALLAGYALDWDPQYANDQALFYAAGGSDWVSVGRDHTTFRARGLDMHVDLLLAGLRRWVREGTYDRDELDLDALRKRTDDDDAITDAWRAARYGPQHPYAKAGLWRYASKSLTTGDAARFRRAHFTPDNATLVIAGRFDPALANRWIDFLFADWSGRADRRGGAVAGAQPVALAGEADSAQAVLAIALPARAGDRAQRLVAAEMLSAIAGDVRHQLGASYGLSATLDEERLATSYSIAGYVEAPRLADAVQLLRDRLAALHADPDAAARAFVTARKQVLEHLVGITGSAHELAARVVEDIRLGREPLSDLPTAGAVRALTIEQMGAVLEDLDLGRAALLLRGPAAETARAFAVLGRTGQTIAPSPTETASTPRPRHGHRARPVDLAEAITTQRAPSATTVTAAPVYAYASLTDRPSLSGAGVVGDLGYVYDAGQAIGVHIAAAHVSGSSAKPELSIADDMFDIAAMAQATGAARLWGQLELGTHIERVSVNGRGGWYAGVLFGVAGGIDIVRIGRHRVGVCGSVGGALLTGTGYSGGTLGLSYRLY